MPSITQQMLAKYYPEHEEIFRDLLTQLLDGCERVLDAGCGDGRIFAYDFKERVDMLVGIDPCHNLAKNDQIHYATRGLVEHMPFADDTFDLVFSRFVLEHVQQPSHAFSEFARVLQPDGTLVVLIPNAWHYFVLAGRMIPHPVQQRIASWVGYREEDTHPTYYRANTCKKLNTLAQRGGLALSQTIMHEPCPWFLSFSPITLVPAIFHERLVNRCEALSPFRAHIIAVFEKPRVDAKREHNHAPN